MGDMDQNSDALFPSLQNVRINTILYFLMS